MMAQSYAREDEMETIHLFSEDVLGMQGVIYYVCTQKPVFFGREMDYKTVINAIKKAVIINGLLEPFTVE